MKVTITTEYDNVVGDYIRPVTIDVPPPPVAGGALVHAYEVQDSDNGTALNAWALEHFSPHSKVESVLVEAADDPMLVGCEFVTKPKSLSPWPETDEDKVAFVDWQYAVDNGDTSLGFRDWQRAEREAEVCATCGDPLDAPTGAGRTASCAAAHAETEDAT